jgi:hypothetical protein
VRFLLIFLLVVVLLILRDLHAMRPHTSLISLPLRRDVLQENQQLSREGVSGRRGSENEKATHVLLLLVGLGLLLLCVRELLPKSSDLFRQAGELVLARGAL